MRPMCELSASERFETRPSQHAHTFLTRSGYLRAEMFTRRQQRRRHAIDAWVRIEMEERLAADGRSLPGEADEGESVDVIELPAAEPRRRSENGAGDEPAARSL
jgi:hypothetical protein